MKKIKKRRIVIVILTLIAVPLLLFVCDELPRWRNTDHLKFDWRVLNLDSSQRVALYFRKAPEYPEALWEYQRDLSEEEISMLRDALFPTTHYMEYISGCPYYLRFDFVGETKTESILVGTDHCDRFSFAVPGDEARLTRNEFLYDLMLRANRYYHNTPDGEYPPIGPFPADRGAPGPD